MNYDELVQKYLSGKSKNQENIELIDILLKSLNDLHIEIRRMKNETKK